MATEATADDGAGWRADLDEIHRRRGRALEMGGAERVERQHQRGKLSARERVDLLFDPGTFEEIGILADHSSARPEMQDFVAPADGVVVGAGEIHGRTAYCFAEDFTVLGGSVGETGNIKRDRVKELAGQERVPLIYLLDGAGARGQEFVMEGWPDSEHFLVQARLSGIVPQVAAVLGGLGGDPALEVPLCDFKVMTKGAGALFAGGPPLVKAATGLDVTKEELGGYQVHTEASGVVDNAAEDDHDAIEQIRRYMSYMPQNCWGMPPSMEPSDDPYRADEELLEILPDDRKQPYDMHRIVDAVVDRDSFFEIQPRFGRALIVGLARLDGHVVGVVANQPKFRAGAFSGEEADKEVHFISVCNSFNIPLIFLVDVPGFMVGPKTEREGVLRRGLRVAWVTAYGRVPNVTVLIRKAYGMGAAAMNGPGGGQSATLCWPTAEFGGLPLEGGVAAAYKTEIAAAENQEDVLRKRYEEVRATAGPFAAARVFNFDELIDPRETRTRIVKAFRRARPRQEESTGPWKLYGVFP
jgi:acetyl-CoA carboxylase carboxyltransferase component